MKTADYPVWLAVMPDQRGAARADAGTHPDGGNAITWSPEDKLWYARPGADLSRLQAWLPDPGRRSGGGDPETEFLDALTDAGLIIDGLPVMDGEIHRVSVTDGPRGNGDGVYRGFLNGSKPGGWFINYWTAKTHKDITKWKATGGESDPVARLHMQAVARQARDDSARALAATHMRQTARAKALYDSLPPADPQHAYFMRKGVTADEDIRQTRNGALVVPLQNVAGDFRTLQYIPPDGEKYLFKEAPKAGNFKVVGGELRNGEPVMYAEGYATAKSLSMATGLPVVMTVDAGNMLNVADALRAGYPDSPHLFMADDDHHKPVNTGRVMAEQAARNTGGAVLMPALTAAERRAEMTDFNDVHQSRGIEALRADLRPRLNEALAGLNYKETVMATPDDAQPAPDNLPSVSPDALPDAAPARRPGAAKEKTDDILKLRDEGLKPAQIAEQLGIGQTSVYRILKAQQSEAVPATPAVPAEAEVPDILAAETSPIVPPVTTDATPAPEPIVALPDVAEQAAAPATVPESPAPALVAVRGPEPAAVQPDVPDVNVPQPAPQVTASETMAVPAPTVAPASPAPSGPYDSYAGLYGAGAELRDRLAALASGQISPAALLQDIITLRSRVESVAVTDVYTREHVKEMREVFDRVTQGGIAGADVMETGAFSRLRGLLGQRDTWSSLHPTGGTLDVNTVPDRIAQQYALLARGDVTRAQFDREVRMLYNEFTRADPGRFTPGRQEETRAMFERMVSLESPERAAQYSAGMTFIAAQLPPASAADTNATALYRIQAALRDEFVSLARGESTDSALTENVARLQAQLDEAKAQGVYADRHLTEVQGAFDRVKQGGLAGMPSPDAPAPRGDFASRNAASASLDVTTVPARIEAQYGLLVRGEVTRAQFEDNLAVLRNEVVRLSESGRVTPAALSAAEVAFTNLSALGSPAGAAAHVPLSAAVISSDAPSPEPAAAPATISVGTPSVATVSEPAAATAVNGSGPQADALPSETTSSDTVTAPHEMPVTATVSVPLASASPVAPSQTTTAQATAADARPESADCVPELSHDDATSMAAESNPQTAATPLAAAFGEENAILVGSPRLTPQDDHEPQETARDRVDLDKLISRITHEKHPDGKSVLFMLDGEPAFVDRANRLVMAEGASSHEEKVLAALLTASEHYHGKIELTGSDEFKAFAIGLIVANDLKVSMKNASQQLALTEARRAAGQPVSPAAPADAVHGDQQAPRAGEAPSAEPVAQTPPADVPVQAASPVTPSSQQRAAPAPVASAPQISPAVHTPAEKAREPVTGKVTAFGQAPFRFEPGEGESTFITLRTKEGPQTFWGKELAGLLREANLKTGRMVTLQWQGKQPVTVKVPKKNAEGVVTHYENENTHRNRWSLSPAGGTRVQTGADDLVPLAAVDVNRYMQIQHTLVSRLGLDIDAPPKPADGLYWLKPDGQGSSQPGDPLSAPRPAHNDRAGVPVMSSWGEDGRPDMLLVQGDGDYLQGVVRQNGIYQHVLVSLPGSPEAPPMVVNMLTPEGAQPIGSGNGINRSNGQPVAREHVVVRLTGDAQPRIAKLDAPADVPAALHARLGYDERYKAESGWVKEQPAAAPQAVPATPPRPAQ